MESLNQVMTHKEENIVNISMMAAELLKEGRIERDDTNGHIGLTESIISLAEKFEKTYAGIDWDAGERDYWIEIDRFAEKELLERYGIERDAREPEPRGAELNVKVIISHGIVEGVLKDSDAPIFVEVVDVDSDYENYEVLEAYREKLYKDRLLMPCDYTIAGVEDLDELEAKLEIPEDPVKVYAVAGSVKHEVFSGNLDECKAFCEENKWRWVDENTFEWCLEIEDSRDDLLPDDYFDALSYYSEKAGRDIESEFTRVNAEKLVACFHRCLEIVEFDYWARYEEVCGVSLTYDEYKAADAAYDGSPYDIGDEDFETVAAIKQSVKDLRDAQAGPKTVPELERLIQAAEDLKQEPDRASGKGMTLDR